MEVLYFYPSKVRFVLIIFLCLAFAVLGFFVGTEALQQGDYFISTVGGVLAVGFGLGTPLLIIKFFSQKPYLILTQEELVVNASAKNPIPIKWEDIAGYHVREVYLNKFIDIVLHDEEKYLDLMTTNVRRLSKLNQAMNAPLFSIVWGQIKRRERDKLTKELDRRAFDNIHIVNEE